MCIRDRRKCEAIVGDHRQTIHDVCGIVGMSYGSVECILSDILGMRRIAAKFVPRMLSSDHKEHRVAACTELKIAARDDPNFISNVITGDESRVYGYDPETKQQLSQWNSPHSPRPKKSTSSS